MKAAEAPVLNNLGLLFASGLAFLSIILTGGWLHIVQLDHQWNWPLVEGWKSTPGLAPRLAILCIVASAFLLIREWRGSGLASLKNWLAWFTLPLLLATGFWIILPADNPGFAVWAVLLGVLACVVWLAARSLKPIPPHGLSFTLAGKDLIADSLIILLPVAVGAWIVDGDRLGLERADVIYSVLTYPFYALVQLFIFLVIPATHMSRRGYSAATISVSCATIFSLAHWPNPLLMAGTGLAMLVWTRQYLRGRSVLMLALVLGIAATGFKFAMPMQWGWEMRIGPDYVEKRAAFDANAKTQAAQPEEK